MKGYTKYIFEQLSRNRFPKHGNPGLLSCPNCPVPTDPSGLRGLRGALLGVRYEQLRGLGSPFWAFETDDRNCLTLRGLLVSDDDDPSDP